MNCHDVQELILESFEQTASREIRLQIEAHLASCDGCSQFALVQRALDERLGALLLPAPVASLGARAALRAKIREEAVPVRARFELLPDIMHFASFAIATLIMAVVLPVSSSTVIGIGVVLAFVSYLVLSAVRDSMDDVLGADV